MTVRKLVDASYHSTICQNCNTVCHDQCGLSEINHTDSNHFRGCAAMSGENCHVCERKCSHTVHYHARKTMTNDTQTMEEILQDIKDKYDNAVRGQSNVKAKITSVADALKLVDQEIDRQKNELLQYCHEIKKICSGFNLVDELHILIEQLVLDSKSLTSLAAITTANNYIKKYIKFV